ncbi:hypothetical protein HK099_000283 [Clydaea vesicula]|uniref:Uncharacterized protein n=1 Tax=Clydaea vesicula TaxID=447962 RepID=A0AAD5U4I3_9FUNG|nr:hypothetical protein HK099_000283 [Clydaea vesicula]
MIRCTYTIRLEYTKDQIFDLDWNFFSDGNGNDYVSRSDPKSHKRNILSNQIYFMIDGVRYLADFTKNTLTYRIKNPPSDIVGSNYKGYEMVICSKKWDEKLFYDIIPTGESFRKSPEHMNRVNITNVNTIFNYNKGHIKLYVYSCGDLKTFHYVISLMKDLFCYYESVQMEPHSTNVSKLDVLKAYDPKLFINTYSRECSILPEIGNVNDFEYPKNSGRYYKASPGTYLGLKENNLENKEEYPFIINCYKQNHSTNYNTLMFKYLSDNVHNRKLDSHSFRSIFGYCSLKKIPELLLQEYYTFSKDKIGSIIDTEECGEKIYRIYEYTLKINIIIVEKRNRVYPLIPFHVYPYFWDFVEDYKTIIILKKKKMDYIIYECDDDTRRNIIEQKLCMTVRSTNITDYVNQVVDIDGKCRMYQTSEGDWIPCESRPLDCPEVSIVPDMHNYLFSITNDIKYLGTQRRYALTHFEKKAKKKSENIVEVFEEEDEDDF